jgi:phosphoserine aminotransferase
MPQTFFNFSAGPAVLPDEVKEQASQDFRSIKKQYNFSYAELSHRGKYIMDDLAETEKLLRELMDISDDYSVLFLQGGASTQFAMVPMNLLEPGKKATYLNTGTWSKKAIKEARLFGDIDVAFSDEENNFTRVPKQDEYQIDDAAEYLYLTSNNTIYGTQFHNFPQTDKMLVCDMSSDILSRKVDVNRFGIIFAGAQKNLGIAGVTIVIIKKNLLDKTPENIPTIFKYKTHADKNSLFNTAPTFNIHVTKLVLKWIKNKGGVSAIEKTNQEKAALLYKAIDESDFYQGHAEKESRSLMNVTFNLPNEELEKNFIEEAAAQGLVNLKGHRSVGGIRASIYNAMPVEGVEALVGFMGKFEKK